MQQHATIITVPYSIIAENNGFQKIISETIDQTLTALGEPIKKQIYHAIEAKHGIKKIEIPQNIEAFANALEYLFGEASLILEIRIIQTLNRKATGFAYRPKREFSFAEYVNALKHYLNR